MDNSSPDYSDAALAIFMFLGLLVLGIGVYLTVSHHMAVGVSTGGRGAPKAGTVGTIRGEFIIAMGIISSAIPAGAYINRFRKKLSQPPRRRRR